MISNVPAIGSKMHTQAINPLLASTGSATADAGLQATQSAGTILQNFATMLITQITNQDPDTPMDPTAIIAQFAQVQTSMGMAQLSQNNAYYSQIQAAMSTVGTHITMVDPSQTNVSYDGVVSGVDLSSGVPAVIVTGTSTTTQTDGTSSTASFSKKVMPITWTNQIDTSNITTPTTTPPTTTTGG